MGKFNSSVGRWLGIETAGGWVVETQAAYGKTCVWLKGKKNWWMKLKGGWVLRC